MSVAHSQTIHLWPWYWEVYTTKQGFTELGGCDQVHRVGVGIHVLIWEGICNCFLGFLGTMQVDGYIVVGLIRQADPHN